MSNSTLDARAFEEVAAGHTAFSAGVQAALLEFANEISELGITIKPLPARLFERGWWGAYDHAERSIYLWPSLGALQARSSLCHELAHAKHGHVGQVDEQEREAEMTAADQLIGMERFKSTALGVGLGGVLRDALGVLPRDLNRFIIENREEIAEILIEAARTNMWTSYPHSDKYRRENQPMMYDRLHSPLLAN